MEGRLFDSRLGKLIACIVFCIMVVLPLPIELISAGFDMSSVSGAFMWPMMVLLSCVTVLHCFGNMTDIRFLSRFVRIIHSIVFYGGIGIIFIIRLVQMFGDGAPLEGDVSMNLAKEAGYFGFLYLTNTLLNGINRKDHDELNYQNARWIMLFAASVAVVPVMLAFQSFLTYETVVVLGFFFIIFDLLYSFPSGNNLTFLGFWGSVLLTLATTIAGIVIYANGMCALLSAGFISLAALAIAYMLAHFILGDKRDRDPTWVGENEIAMCFVFPAVLLVAGIALGFVSLAKSWAVYISMPISMLVIYLVVKGVIYPKESKKEKERRNVVDWGPLDLPPGYTNRQAVDAICDRINSADLMCGTYSHEFFAHARASVDGVSGNTFTIRVRYSIYSTPNDRSTPNAGEDRDLRNDAYRKVRKQFEKYQNQLKGSYNIDFIY